MKKKKGIYYFYFEHLFIIFADGNNRYIMSPRPKNIRKINNMPSVAGFKPIASDCYRKDAIFLHFEEYVEKPLNFDPFGHARFAHLFVLYD